MALVENSAVRHTSKDNYKWVALFNCTLGTLMATLDGSIVLIAMPDIFRGIHLDPLDPGNTSYLLWMILGFLIVTSVLVVNFGRLGDLFGRVKLYNLGFVVYTTFSLFLAIDWMSGSAGALWLVVMRVFQGVGSALLLAQSPAILTDAFPEHQRGLALGIQNIAGISGIFIGLVLGGLLAPIDWRLIFFISVPFGILGTVLAYLKLEERGVRRRAPIDWVGNLTFAVGLVLLMVGITYGIEPSGRSTTGWTSVPVLTELSAGIAFLAAFVVIENVVDQPMFRLALFRIRAFTAGTFSTLLAGIARGGLMFILIIWLQGIWLPEHGYSFSQTPLWAGIYMLPLTGGFLLSGPLSGALSDRFGSRPFATGGMLLSALTYVLLMFLPVNFSYGAFAALLFMNGIAMGTFASPNRVRGDEQPAATAPRSGRWHELHLPERRGGAFDRDLLHAAHRRSRRKPACFTQPRIGLSRPLPLPGGATRPSPTGVGAVRGVPRRQPAHPPATGKHDRAPAERPRPHVAIVLPVIDRRAVQERPA